VAGAAEARGGVGGKDVRYPMWCLEEDKSRFLSGRSISNERGRGN
jgi:hypothetical protein